MSEFAEARIKKAGCVSHPAEYDVTHNNLKTSGHKTEDDAWAELMFLFCDVAKRGDDISWRRFPFCEDMEDFEHPEINFVGRARFSIRTPRTP